MSEATLVAHCGARKVGLAELANLPAPQPMGRFHRPVHHYEFVHTLKELLSSIGLVPAREEYAIQTSGQKLFGVIDFAASAGTIMPADIAERGLAIGIRHANDQSMAIRMVAGTRVFVCDNLALSGDQVVMERRHTSGLSLRDEIRRSLDRMVEQYARLEESIARLRERGLPDREAKELIYEAFVRGEEADAVLPLRLLPVVHQWYFHPPAEATDCQPRTAWGLHNAFTRAIKEIPSPARQFTATSAVGRYLGLRSANLN